MGGPDATLLSELESAGVDREGIDLVVLTHIHPDHVGWNLSDGSPTFPNARYLVTRTDWDHWTQPEIRAQAPHVDEQMLPLEGLNVLDLIEGEYSVTDELTTLLTPGHTPGHISVVVSSGGGERLHTGRRGALTGPGAVHRLESGVRHRPRPGAGDQARDTRQARE